MRHALRLVGLVALIVAITTTIFFAVQTEAAPGVNQTIGFQGRLLSSTGGIVPDGYYNIQFKIYQDGAGSTAGNPGGTLKWTESYTNNGGTAGVRVKNGAFSVNLGSKTAFGSNIDWNQDTLWLSMNVAGSESACTTFGTTPCTADGEMLPMKRITAAPYALNSGQFDGKTADKFVQLGLGIQTDASNNSSIAINKTGGGNLLQLQNTATDVFTVTSSGNLILGSTATKLIAVDDSAENQAGTQLQIRGGNGGTGSGSDGGELNLQGGSAGGTNGNGGNVNIDAGAPTGTGSAGYIAIGTNNASTILVGSTYKPVTQNILIGANDTAGSSSTVIIGAGSSAASGTTQIRSKDDTIITTDGVDRATFDTDGVLTLGNGTASTTPSDFRIQGTASSASGVSGGNLTVQGGNATTGNTNGGDLKLSGGSGSGTGAKGLVVIDTPTYATADLQSSATDTSVTQSNIDSFGLIKLEATADDVDFTLGAPSLGSHATGRILYVTATSGSHNFNLRANVGGGAGIEQTLSLAQNQTATLIWTGSLWSVAGASNSSTLQSAYENSVQSAGDATITADSRSNGVTIKDSATTPVDSTVLEVQSSDSTKLFSVNSKVVNGTEHATDGGVHDGTNFTTNWPAIGSASVSRITTDGQEGGDSAEVIAGTGANNGIGNALSISPATNATYRVSLYGKLVSGSAFTDLIVMYSPNHDETLIACENYNTRTLTTDGWTQITCDITTDGTTAGNPHVYIGQPTTADTARTFLIDTLSFTRTPTNTSNVKIGSGSNEEDATLFTLDSSDSAPTADNDDALLGSMYYDTALGKVQCYEAEGWGNCGDSPDTFVTLSPEYAGAVMNGTDIGTITSDLCSDTLNVNDGSSGQPTVCGSGETQNFYNWTTEETSDQTRSIYVSYQLPNNFKEFVAGSTSLMGRTDSGDASVAYQVYRDSPSAGLISCGGSPISVSSGAQSTWQKVAASGGADPSTCGFEPGDSILIRINLTAKGDTNAYVSDLGFTFSNE